MLTTLIHSGDLFDGLGGSARKGHLLLRDDRIEALLPVEAALPDADVVIDARGQAIAPGFIDMHSHADWLLPAEQHPELLACMLEQGVTTVVGGNCGTSPAPAAENTRARLHAFAEMVIDGPFETPWFSMKGFLDRLEEVGPSLNLAELAGHAALRYAGSDTLRGPMPQRDLDATLDAARQALDQGACGLSFGLGYDPGMYSPQAELEALCRVAAQANKPVTVHLKAFSRISPCYPMTTLGAHNLRALDEMLEVGRKSGVSLQLSHFIVVGRRSWSTAGEALARVDRAREQGLDVMIDAFPYTCGNTTIVAPFPYWFLARLPNAYNSRSARARLRVELEVGFRLAGFRYPDFQVMDSGVEGWEELNGLRVDQIAAHWGTSCFDAMLRLAERSRGAALMLFHSYSGEPGREEALESVLRHPACLFETDTVLRSTGYPNPASLGTFPRILGPLCRDRKLFDLATAIRRMTSASAERFGLTERGVLAPGKAADVVVFDPERISDRPPSDDRPAGRPIGIDHVFLNGQQVVRQGVAVPGLRAGRILRR
ncbi:MAG: amidohydrolase family protein [bacterium]|nr:amidohydrolase family protein [bacterium]